MAGLWVLSAACAQKTEPVPKTTILSGVITVDGSNDLTGIIVDITMLGDTLFKAETDIDGYFSGVITVSQPGAYPFTISRNNRILHVGDVILAPGDTIRISGAIPRLAQTFQAESRENNAWQTLLRLNRQYDRLMRIATSGVVTPDSVRSLILQWSDLYWSLRESSPGTYAAEQGSMNSIEMLFGVDNEKLSARISELGNSKSDFATKLTVGAELALQKDGLEAGLAYVDALKASVKDKELKSSADMRRIELMLVMGDETRALAEVNAFRRTHKGTAYDNWAESLEYELMNLIPGKRLPDFTIYTSQTDSITSQSLKGKPYMIEFVTLAGGPYVATYPALARLHAKAAPKGIRFITVPLDAYPEIIDGFFIERKKQWTFTPFGAFNRSAIGDQLRVDRVPMRYLVGSDGLVIGRYFVYDTAEFEADLNPLLTIPNL